MLNESEITVKLQKINMTNLMNFFTGFFNINTYLVLIFILYITDIINNNNIYNIILVNLLGLIIKIFYKRNRPYVVYKNIKNLTNIDYSKSIFSVYSLPSGHTIQATILSLILVDKYNSNFYLCLPAIIGLSRIYLGVHYVSDVILAIFVSTIVYYYF